MPSGGTGEEYGGGKYGGEYGGHAFILLERRVRVRIRRKYGACVRVLDGANAGPSFFFLLLLSS